MKEQQNELEPRRVTRSEFLQDPARVMRLAEEGPVTVTDDKGNPRNIIYCPRNELPVYD